MFFLAVFLIHVDALRLQLSIIKAKGADVHDFEAKEVPEHRSYNNNQRTFTPLLKKINVSYCFLYISNNVPTKKVNLKFATKLVQDSDKKQLCRNCVANFTTQFQQKDN